MEMQNLIHLTHPAKSQLENEHIYIYIYIYLFIYLLNFDIHTNPDKEY